MECPLCGFEVDENKVLQKHGEYKLYGCPGCTNGFWWPMKGQSAEFYSLSEANSYALRHDEAVLSIGENHRRFFKNMGVKKGKLIDIGCAEGSFLKAAEKQYEVYGIDFDANSVAAARKFGLRNVHVSTPAQFAESNPGKFGIVTFFEVLEHQEDPGKFIRDVKKLLASGGRIAGSVPLHETVAPVGPGDTPPHHFILFTRPGLVKFLELSGFEGVFTETAFGPEHLRREAGLDVDFLKSFFLVKADTSRSSVQYRAYSVARGAARLCLPVIHSLFNLKEAVLGRGQEKISAEARKQFVPFYFQARIP